MADSTLDEPPEAIFSRCDSPPVIGHERLVALDVVLQVAPTEDRRSVVQG